MGGRSSSFRRKSGGGLASISSLPKLEGSEKQVKWASEIRDEFKDQFNYFEKHYLDKKYDAGEDYKAKTGKFPSRRRGGFPQFLKKPEIKAKVEESRKIGTKQDTSKEYTKALAYKGYKANEYTGIKERTDFKTEKEYHDYLVKGARKAFSEKSASWWIDHRKK